MDVDIELLEKLKWGLESYISNDCDVDYLGLTQKDDKQIINILNSLVVGVNNYLKNISLNGDGKISFHNYHINSSKQSFNLTENDLKSLKKLKWAFQFYYNDADYGNHFILNKNDATNVINSLKKIIEIFNEYKNE